MKKLISSSHSYIVKMNGYHAPPENMGGTVETKHQPILLPFTNVQNYQDKQLIPVTSQVQRG